MRRRSETSGAALGSAAMKAPIATSFTGPAPGLTSHTAGAGPREDQAGWGGGWGRQTLSPPASPPPKMARRGPACCWPVVWGPGPGTRVRTALPGPHPRAYPLVAQAPQRETAVQARLQLQESRHPPAAAPMASAAILRTTAGTSPPPPPQAPPGPPLRGHVPLSSTRSCLSKNSASLRDTSAQAAHWRTGSTKHMRGSATFWPQHLSQKHFPQRRQWCWGRVWGGERGTGLLAGRPQGERVSGPLRPRPQLTFLVRKSNLASHCMHRGH